VEQTVDRHRPAVACVCWCEGEAMSNPAVEVDEMTTPVDDVPDSVPSVMFVSGFDNEDDNVVQHTADVSDAGDVDEQMPLAAAAAANVDSVCTLLCVVFLCFITSICFSRPSRFSRSFYPVD